MLALAWVSWEQAKPQRARLSRWYAAGEPAWMAADSLKMFVRAAERPLVDETMGLRGLFW